MDDGGVQVAQCIGHEQRELTQREQSRHPHRLHLQLHDADGVRRCPRCGYGGFTTGDEKVPAFKPPRCVRAELKADSGLSATASIVQEQVCVPASSQRTSGHGDPSAVWSPVQAAGALLFSLRRWLVHLGGEFDHPNVVVSEAFNPASASTSGRRLQACTQNKNRAEWRAG
jgi:hypothetical protein